MKPYQNYQLLPAKTAVFARNQPFFLTFYMFLVSIARDLTTYYIFAFTPIHQILFLAKFSNAVISVYFCNIFVSFGVTRTI